MSNPKPIEEAATADLRHSRAALLRAAQRAREIAAQSGTALVIWRDGRLEFLDPVTGKPATPRVAEPGSPYGKRT